MLRCKLGVCVCVCCWGDCISPHCHRQPTKLPLSCYFNCTRFPSEWKGAQTQFSIFFSFSRPSQWIAVVRNPHTKHTCDSFPVRTSSDIPSHLHFQWANLTVYECDAVAYECADSKVMTTRLGYSDCTIKDVCIFCTIKKFIFDANGQQRKIGMKRNVFDRPAFNLS